MNKKEKLILFIFIVILVLVNKFFKISDDYDLNIIINVEAIFIGFSATAFSIIATNKYSKELYSIEVKTKKSKTTQFDILLNKLKIPTYYNLILMFVILLTNFFDFPHNYYAEIVIINLSLLGVFLNFISIRYLYAYCRKAIVEMKKSE